MSLQTIESKKIIGGKDFLTISELSSEAVFQLLDSAVKIKEKWKAGEEYLPLKGKILGMIFEKSSTRTRVSFETGMLQLGGHALFLSSHDIQLGRGETVSDTAKVLSQFVNGIMIRTFGHEKIEELAAAASVPVINGLTDTAHPCQALADLLTIMEVKGTLKGKKAAFIGDGNNVVHSLMAACAKTGMDFSIACPPGYEPDADITRKAEETAKENGCIIEILSDPKEAAANADVIYGDVWTSMGQEEENARRLEDFKNYQITDDIVQNAKEDYLFMHCLPAHRGEEVAAEVIDGPNSVVFQQAGNRLHAQKAILVDLLS